MTTLLCTPTYALRLAEVAAEHKINLHTLTVEKIIVAGEPGGSVPATRERIESAWGARVIDHGGATEVGPWGFADADGRGLHVNEAEFIAEFVSVATGHPAQAGRALALDPHDARPRRRARHSLSHRRPGAAHVARRAAPTASCCSKAASSAGPTT